MGEQVFNITFVQTVQKYPCVYDHTRMDYCLRHITEAAWADISKEVNEDVKTCKEKWKNLRTVFRRNLLKDGSSTKRPYYLNEHMQFMIPLLQGSKKRARNWFHYQQLDGSGMDDLEPESPKDDVCYVDEDEDEDKYRPEDSPEDPLGMVETVITRDSPSVESSPGKQYKDNSPVTQIKIEPGTEHERSMTKPMRVLIMNQPQGVTLVNRLGMEESRYGKNDMADQRRQSLCDNDDSFEHPRKKIKLISQQEPRSDSSLFEARKPQCSCTECPDTQFLLSLIPDLKQMTSRQKRKFKKEIFNLLDTILDDRGNEASLHAPNLPSSTSIFVQRK